jgi:hypothetical protein
MGGPVSLSAGLPSAGLEKETCPDFLMIKGPQDSAEQTAAKSFFLEVEYPRAGAWERQKVGTGRPPLRRTCPSSFRSANLWCAPHPLPRGSTKGSDLELTFSGLGT